MGFAQRTYRRRSEKTSLLLDQLFGRFREEGFALSYTMEDFVRDYIKEHFPKLTPEEQQEVLESLPPEKRLVGLPAEKRLAGLLNYTLARDGETYVSEDPEKLHERIIHVINVLARAELQKLPLREALRASDELVKTVKAGLIASANFEPV